MIHKCNRAFCFVSPEILSNIAEKGTPAQREAALATLRQSAVVTGERSVIGGSPSFAMAPPGSKRRTIYDAQQGFSLPGTVVRREGDPAHADIAVNEAYDGSGEVYDFFSAVFSRNSIDDRGMALDSTVHFRRRYNNAQWNGAQMLYGDGDGDFWNRFTIAKDVIAHELSHGVTDYESGLIYFGQSGALNESFSDVMGSCFRQWYGDGPDAAGVLGNRSWTVTDAEDPAKAGWLCGVGLLKSTVATGMAGQPVSLRSMMNPGNAYNDPVFGKDPQPAKMADLIPLDDPRAERDNGGVHLNSGIPNLAFYRLARRLADGGLGNHAFNAAGRIWYNAFRRNGGLRRHSSFQDAANVTFNVAGILFGDGSAQQNHVRDAWDDVGISIGVNPGGSLFI